MRVPLSTYDPCGGVEPLAGLAVRLRALGAEVRVCAPPLHPPHPLPGRPFPPDVTDNGALE
jgi:hypothetical protein